MNALLMHDLPILVGLLAKTTLLMLAAAAMSLFLRRASAATRHLVWTAALAGVLLLPLLSASVPNWNVRYARRAAMSSPQPISPPSDAQAPPLSGALELGPVGGLPSSGAALRESSAHELTAVALPSAAKRQRAGRTLPLSDAVLGSVLCAWLVGSIAVLLHLAIGLRRVGQLGRLASALGDGVVPIAEAARQQIGPRRPVRFQRAADSSAVAVPVTWGFLRPVVLLPAQSSVWSEDCLQAALLHELAHVRRGDWPTQLMGRLACALYWWHPLVWLAARKAREESERACDDLVLSTGIKPADYAQRLVEVVRSIPSDAPVRTIAVAMAQPSEVEGRVRAVLTLGSNRRPLTGRRIMSGCALSGLLILPTAAIRVSPSAQAQAVSTAHATGAIWSSALTGDGAPYGTFSLVTQTADGVAILPGGRAAFPKGYEVSLVAVTQATREGDEWNMYGGPWWRPDGTPIGIQSGGTDGHWHWTVTRTRGLAPFVFKFAFRAPAPVWQQGNSISPGFYEQFPGALKANEHTFQGLIVINGLQRTVKDITSPLVDDSAPQRYGGNVSSTRSAEIYSKGTRACTLRCGVAAGPWRTVSSHSFTLTPASVTRDLSQGARYVTDVSLNLDDHPSESYLDARGRPHIFYFLGASGHLGNVARRFVALDSAGRVIPLNEIGQQRVGLAFGKRSDVTSRNPPLDLASVKEFRLQTCPYQTVEFRNVQLQPAGGVRDIRTLLALANTQQIEQARQLRAHLQNWAQGNRALVQRMAKAGPNELTALMPVYNSLQRLPFPLWSGDPRLGSEEAAFSIALPTRLTLIHLQKSRHTVETGIRRDFARFRDLAVSQSSNVGTAHITVWASGRITRSTAMDHFIGHGKPIRKEESEQEIVPAFFAAGIGPGASPGRAGRS